MIAPLRAFLAVFRALVLSTLREEKLRSLLALAGVALGVAVVVAVGLANAATLRAFATTVDAVVGRAQLQVRPAGPALDERLLADVQQFGDVELAAPVLRLAAGVREAPGEVLTILAVDVVNDAAFRDHHLALDAEATLPVLLDARSIVVTEAFARRHALAVGDAITLLVDTAVVPLRVAALLSAEGAAAAADRNLAIMDIAAAQDRFDQRGRLGHIDVLVRPGADVDRVRAGLAAFLPRDVAVERPDARGATVDKMIRAFQYNLEALSHVALLVGVFLVYNTVSVSVVRRRAEIGTLRALGARRGEIAAAFLGEGLLLAAPGAIAGCAGGWGLAHLLVEGMADTISYHWVRVRIDGVALDAAVLLRGVAVGVACALVASWMPAREAAAVAPANTTRAGSLDARLRRGRPWLVPLGAAQLAAAWWMSGRPPVHGVPVFGFAAGFLVIFGFATLAPLLLRAIDALLAPLYARLFGAHGLLAVSFVDGSRSRTTVAVTGLMVGLAMVVSVGIMVGSFRGTVVRWMEQTVRADLFVRAASLGPNAHEPLLPLPLAERLAATDGVAAADLFRTWRADLDGRVATYGSGDIGVFERHAHLAFLGPRRPDRLEQLQTTDAVIVSETFAYRHGVAEGDVLDLPVEGGRAPFVVAGVYREYSSDLGYVLMDRARFLRHFPSEDRVNGVSLYLEPGVDPDALRTRLLDEFGAEANLLLTTNREVRRHALAIFDDTFRVTHALMLIAMIVSVLGVTNTLLAMIVDRRRELLTLRYVGMARGAVARVVMLESSLLSAAGTVLGLACGIALSFLLIYVVNRQSFGWTIEFDPPIATLAGATLLLYLVSLLAGLLPAREAARMAPRRAG